jgi:hypothetical protein
MLTLGLTDIGQQIDDMVHEIVNANSDMMIQWTKIYNQISSYVSIAKHVHKLRYRRDDMLNISLKYVTKDFMDKYWNITGHNFDKELLDMILMFLDELFSPEFMPTSNRYIKMATPDMPVGYIAGWNDTDSEDLETDYSEDKYNLVVDFKFSPSTVSDVCIAGKVFYSELLPARIVDPYLVSDYKLFLDSYIKLFAALGLIEFRNTKKGQYVLKLIKNIITDDFNSARLKYEDLVDKDIKSYSDNIIVSASKTNFECNI